jgi:hypothetical protein
MTTITVRLEDSKVALLREKAEKYGLSPDQFVTASIEDLLAQPEPEFEAALRRVFLDIHDSVTITYTAPFLKVSVLLIPFIQN